MEPSRASMAGPEILGALGETIYGGSSTSLYINLLVYIYSYINTLLKQTNI
jgi:hypothetical protein